MKWWWLVGGVIFVVLMEVNVRIYGGAATFGVPIGWMTSMLVMAQFRKSKLLSWPVSFGVIIFGVTILLSIPKYSIVEAEEALTKTYNDVMYVENVPTTGGDWNPFNPSWGYRFKTSSGESLLFIPDSGNVFEL